VSIGVTVEISQFQAVMIRLPAQAVPSSSLFLG
jgi:hypothetical protein